MVVVVNLLVRRVQQVRCRVEQIPVIYVYVIGEHAGGVEAGLHGARGLGGVSECSARNI